MTELTLAVTTPVDLVVQIGHLVVTPQPRTAAQHRTAPQQPHGPVADVLDLLRSGRPGVALTGPGAGALAHAAATAWSGAPLAVAVGIAGADHARALVADGAQAVVTSVSELAGLAVDGWAVLRAGPADVDAPEQKTLPGAAESTCLLVRDALHRAGDTAGEATAWLQLAELAARGGRAAVALDRAGRAVALFDAFGAQPDRARATVVVGEALLALGEPGPALRAFALARRGLPTGPDAGRALLGVADALVARGSDPRPVLSRAAAACAGHRAGEVGVLRRLGDAHAAAGEQAAAIAAYRRALPLLDDPRAAVLLGVLEGHAEVTVQSLDQHVPWPAPPGGEPDAVLHALAALVPAVATALLGWRAISSLEAGPRTPAPTAGPGPGS